MRKRSVPYTINRRGVYYLNLRWNNQFIRQSLATKDPMEAFQKVNQLAPIFSNPQTCEQTLRQQVSEMVGSGTRLKGKAGREMTNTWGGGNTTPTQSTGYLSHQEVSGLSRICYYKGNGGKKALNVKSTEICPVSYVF